MTEQSFIGLFISIIVVLLVGRLVAKLYNLKTTTPTTNPSGEVTYAYRAKPSLLTPTELSFYRQLTTAVDGKYHIVPQAHLSTFLDHRIKGQNWRAALATVQRKSVDFLLCSKETLRPIIAIELDDASHNRPDRISRDMLVANILISSNIQLVRFSVGEWGTVDDIRAKINRFNP